jgi:hypothetical protein
MKEQSKFRLWAGDIILILCLVLISIIIFIITNHNNNQGRFFTVKIGKETIYRYSLLSDTLITFEGKTGEIIVKVKNRNVRVHKSSCPQKICVKMGWISKPGESIICVPNNMVIRIEGKTKGEVDAITR